MSKRYRFVLILSIMALCFVFLLPTIRWYFWVPRLDQARALQTRERIRSYASETAAEDLENLLAMAHLGGALPEEFEFLIPAAETYYNDINKPLPEKWDAHAVLSGFPDEYTARSAIETHYREDILALKALQKNAVQLGLDLSGGLSIVLQADMEALEEKLGRGLTDSDRINGIERALEVLNSRIDQFGLTEPVIRRQGQDQIYVEIPGTADPERINDIIMGKGSLAFHMVDEEATAKFNSYYSVNRTTTFNERGELLNPQAIALPSDVVIRGVYQKDSYGLDEQVVDSQGYPQYVAVKRDVGLDGNYITEVDVGQNTNDPMDPRPAVTFSLSPEGGEIFYTLTSANVGKTMAIVLDDKVRSSAVIRDAIRDRVSLTGFETEEANNIALLLETAALPVELEVVTQQSIGATMGADTITRGFYALLGGLAAVLIFMVLYYRVAGINAVIAQVLNFYIMFSVLSAFNFTLTLPSIAGFILTIGMAVDANVIIFERMKEELRTGKGRKAAVEAGFNKAFWAIMDSNITTFIAALFLSQLGSGPIKGFAVSLAVGIFSSVFTALFVSRLIFDFGTDVLGSKKLSVSWRIK